MYAPPRLCSVLRALRHARRPTRPAFERASRAEHATRQHFKNGARSELCVKALRGPHRRRGSSSSPPARRIIERNRPISAIIALETSSLEMPAFEVPHKILRRGAKSRLRTMLRLYPRLSSRAACAELAHERLHMHTQRPLIVRTGQRRAQTRQRGLLGR